MSFIALSIGLGVGALGSIAGGIIQGNAAKSAAKTQANASEQAAQIQQNEFNTITQQEQPWMQAGQGAQSQLNYLLGNGTPGTAQTAGSSSGGTFGSLLTPFSAQMMQQYSPAYKFQLQQGINGTLAGEAGGMGALSGAAQQGLESFNQNYANTAFNNAFNQYNAQQSNIYQRLAGVSQLGQNAAANTGQQGTALAGSEGQAVSNVGTALAGGQVGAANAYAGALGNVGNLGTIYALMGKQSAGAGVDASNSFFENGGY